MNSYARELRNALDPRLRAEMRQAARIDWSEVEKQIEFVDSVRVKGGTKMKAIITSLQSGTSYTDGEMRVTLRFADGEGLYSELKLPVSKLGLSGVGTGPHLDQEVEVTLSAVKVRK